MDILETIKEQIESNGILLYMMALPISPSADFLPAQCRR